MGDNGTAVADAVETAVLDDLMATVSVEEVSAETKVRSRDASDGAEGER